jgi:hypothetical protein
MRDPAAGRLELSVQAVQTDGNGLRRTSAILDGTTLASADIGEPGCQPGACPAVGGAILYVATAAAVDGPHRLEVTVEDGAGDVVHLLDEMIAVRNAPVTPVPPVTVTVTVQAGLDVPQAAPATTAPVGPTSTSSAHGCRSPRLSMLRVSEPLRTRHGVPVLRAGRLYRFRARVSCEVGGRRKRAPAGTRVEVHDYRHGRSVKRVVARVRSRGVVAVKLRHRRSCAVVFLTHGVDGKRSSARLPIRTATHVTRAQ